MKARAFLEPGVRRGAFPHDLFIWKGCGCLLSPAGRRRRRAGGKVKSLVKSRLRSQLRVYCGCFLSGTRENICSSVCCSGFCCCFFIFIHPHWGFLGTQTPFFSQQWIKFDSQLSCKMYVKRLLYVNTKWVWTSAYMNAYINICHCLEMVEKAYNSSYHYYYYYFLILFAER